MNMRHVTVYLTALFSGLACGLPHDAFAQDYSRSGFYVGVGGSYQVNLFDNELRDLTQEIVSIDNSSGVNAQLGFRLLPFLSLEAEFESLSGFDLQVANTGVAKLDGDAYTANLKFYLPISRFQPFLKAGVGAVNYSLKDNLGLALRFDDTAFAGRIGGGVDFYLTENFLVFAGLDAVLTTHDLSNPVDGATANGLYFLSARGGLSLRF